MRECFDRHGCDKGRKHGYERVYEPLFRPYKDKPIRILEIGIFKGASLSAWVDYFPKAEIVGIDTFQRIPPGKIPILKHERVSWFKQDSTKPCDYGWFDIVIDDGNHAFTAQRKTLNNFIDKCGMYFIEDVWALNKMTPRQRKHKWLKNEGYSPVDYYWLLTDLEKHTVEYFDMRKGHQPDSFVIKVTD